MLFACATSLAQAAEVTLTPVADASIFGRVPEFEVLADGQGPYLWTATTAAAVARRALVRFDLSSIPAGAQVQQVFFSLYLSRAQDADPLVRLHRLTVSWTEGPANGGSQGHGAPAAAGDVTWLRRTFPALAWAQPGGDFQATPSASVMLGFSGERYTWGPTAAMASDVQGWLADPSTNHGWIVIGDEVNTKNAKRFESRAFSVPSVRPTLRVVYEPAVATADGDIPVPAWALGVLAVACAGALLKRRPSS